MEKKSLDRQPAESPFGRGFTLVELILVMGIFAVLVSFASINLLRPQSGFSLDTAVTTLAADLKEQQLKAMAGDSDGQPTARPFGVYFESSHYILFRGETYSSTDPSNFTVNLGDNLNIVSVSFPSAQVVFTRRSGEVINPPFPDGTVTLRTTLGEEKTLTINRYGVITIN